MNEPRRILVVDDNEDIHNDFRKTLLGSKSAPSAAASRLAGAKAALFDDSPSLAGPASGAPAALAGPAGAGGADPVTFELDSALQGQEGLAKVAAAVAAGRPYTVAFVDMRMPPGWDGLQTIQRLWDVAPDLQVVICTAYSDHSWQEITEKLGLTDRLLILKKPFDPVEVSQLATALSEKWVLKRAAKLRMDELEVMVERRTRELARLALHDRLTGLPNRALLNDRLTQAIARSRREPEYRFALLFLDFDQFKIINDSLGHEAGDHLLVEIAKRLGESTRPTDTVSAVPPPRGAADAADAADAARERTELTLAGATPARLGGDEFVVLLDGVRHAADAAVVAERLLARLGEPYPVAGRSVTSTASIGITTSELGYEKAEDMIRDADTAMYHAKAAGRARYVLFDRRMHEEVTARLEMESDLRQALPRGELVLHYQPIVSLATGRCEGVEALLRWRHPRRGLIPPADFIPCCEETGLIVPVGLWALEQSCLQLQAWHRLHPALGGLTLSVNVSARQLATPDFAREVQAVLARTGLPPGALILEITESVMIRSADRAAKVMRDLRGLGVRLHMDDFGTGYSSLSCLHQFPLNALKIDRSFIHNLGGRQDYTAVVTAIVSLARNLGLAMVAEGIETADQIALLRSMGCELAQGYYFARPADPAQIEPFLLDATSETPARGAGGRAA